MSIRMTPPWLSPNNKYAMLPSFFSLSPSYCKVIYVGQRWEVWTMQNQMYVLACQKVLKWVWSPMNQYNYFLRANPVVAPNIHQKLNEHAFFINTKQPTLHQNSAWIKRQLSCDVYLKGFVMLDPFCFNCRVPITDGALNLGKWQVHFILSFT